MNAASPWAAPPEPALEPASTTAGGAFGLYAAADFVVTDGRRAGGATIPQACWYFRDETIAVPRAGSRVAGFAHGVRTPDDVRAWAAARPADAPTDFPPLVWVAAPQILRGVTLSADAATLVAGTAALPCRLTPKIPLNRSYFDVSSARWLAQRPLSVRGRTEDGTFIVRTLWPEDFRLGIAAPERALPPDPSPAAALRALMREGAHGGATAPFATSVLWRRPGSGDWTGRPVLAFVVNGAQGDDDEAHAGHFGIVTGRIGADGKIGDWLVNNFYALDSESEKGIIAAPVPLDNYLGDLNSGQAWYRPSCLLVAVLRDERAAAFVQSALGRVYNQFYRHQLAYYHPMVNCTSISVDTLRALGWDVPSRGPTSRLLAALGFPFLVLRDRSLTKAALGYDYLTEDRTRLLPAVALEEIFGSLLGLARAGEAVGTGTIAGGTLTRMLAEDLDALAFVRVPQFPSSRAWGDAPVVTLAEYRSRLPGDPGKLQIVPVPPRPFPDELRDPDLLPSPPHRSDRATAVWGVLLVVGIPWVLRRAWRQWRARRRARTGST
jgi:hypothetical protein